MPFRLAIVVGMWAAALPTCSRCGSVVDAVRGRHPSAHVAAGVQHPAGTPHARPLPAKRLPASSGPLPSCPTLPDVPAFPGAQGFGAVARGGRCGRVIHVTNLNTGGPGSFAEAMHQSGPRYVVFDVSGVIDDSVGIERGGTGRVTVAGQTSPGGITIRGLKFNEEAQQDGGDLDDIIVRFIRSRPDGAGLDDALRLTWATKVIVDHCSFGRASDECIQISFASDVTVQATILSETLGDHSPYGGMLVNYSDPPRWPLDRLSIHHDMWNRIQGRMPELSREDHPSSARTFLDIELSSNLLWDPGIGIWVKDSTELGGDLPIYYRMNWVDNYLVARPSYHGFMMLDEILNGDRNELFFSGNRHSAFPELSDFQLVYCCDDLDVGGPNTRPAAGHVRTSRLPFPEVTYTPALELPAWMVANVGAFPRDPMDRRLLGAVERGRVDLTPWDRAPADDALQTAFPAGHPPAIPADTDRDGMPDDWESAHGLDPHRDDANGTSVSRAMYGYDGYTNVECWFNELADRRVTEGRRAR